MLCLASELLQILFSVFFPFGGLTLSDDIFKGAFYGLLVTVLDVLPFLYHIKGLSNHSTNHTLIVYPPLNFREEPLSSLWSLDKV